MGNPKLRDGGGHQLTSKPEHEILQGTDEVSSTKAFTDEAKQLALDLYQSDPELTYRAVAEKLNLPFSAVKNYLQKAVRKAKQAEQAKQAEHPQAGGSNDGSLEPAVGLGVLDTASGPAVEYQEIAPGLKGIVAVRNIKAGELLLEEERLVALPLQCKNNCLLFKLWEKSLPAALKEKLFELHDYTAESGGEKSLEGIFMTNAWGGAEDTSDIYFEISRFNHSCEPNAGGMSAGGVKRVYAMRNIAKGDEVFVCYSSNVDIDAGRNIGLMSTAARQRYWLDHFGFKCMCCACSREPEERTRDDKQREECCKLLCEIGLMQSPTIRPVCRSERDVMQRLEKLIGISESAPFFDDDLKVLVYAQQFRLLMSKGKTQAAKELLRQMAEICAARDGPEREGTKEFYHRLKLIEIGKCRDPRVLQRVIGPFTEHA